jgi:hypothetical protein
MTGIYTCHFYIYSFLAKYKKHKKKEDELSSFFLT